MNPIWQERLAGWSQLEDFRAVTEEVSKALHELAHYSWAGIYMVEGSDLVLWGWSGDHATEHVRIPIGTGICGLAAKEEATVVVDDVSQDPRYLECFVSTRSEIVVPIFSQGACIGEIDIDSDKLKNFGPEDQAFLEELADQLGRLYAATAVS